MRNLFLFLAIFFFCANCLAFEPAPPLTDREIIESLTELKAGQVGLDKRFDDMGKRIDDTKGLLYAILAGIFVLIGFVLWDRRTTLAPTACPVR